MGTLCLDGWALLVGIFIEGVMRNLPDGHEYHLGLYDPPLAFFYSILACMGIMFLGSTWPFSIPLLLLGYGLYRTGKYVAGMLQQYTIVKKDEDVN